MDWFAALVTRANADAGVTAAIGTSGKVYPEQAPQGTARPYATLFNVSATRGQTLKGWDLESGRVQIDVWADSYNTKNAIMEALLTALVPGGEFNGHKFQRA